MPDEISLSQEELEALDRAESKQTPRPLSDEEYARLVRSEQLRRERIERGEEESGEQEITRLLQQANGGNVPVRSHVESG